MEFMGYATEEEKKKVYAAKPSNFDFFKLAAKKMNPVYPITDHLTNPEAELKQPKHEDEDSNLSDPPLSEQEEKLHRIRDRIRLRLNLLDFDFRMLEDEVDKERARKEAK